MTIQTFIQDDVLLPRLKRNGVLVVYDPAQRYRTLCLELASAILPVVDTTESSIESREAAMQALSELGQPHTTLAGLLVYVPTRVPLTEEAKQLDPFALYAACGSLFPDGDGDEYLSLCLKSKPDHATAIRQIFAHDPNPDFAVINAVGSGLGWPNLRALLGAESTRDILFALLIPNDTQLHALKGQEGWAVEARNLCATTLGLTLKTRARAWSALAEELWRFLLFSEFAFHLPEPLPEALANVPRAPQAARPLVEDLCERLRHEIMPSMSKICVPSSSVALILPAIVQDGRRLPGTSGWRSSCALLVSNRRNFLHGCSCTLLPDWRHSSKPISILSNWDHVGPVSPISSASSRPTRR